MTAVTTKTTKTNEKQLVEHFGTASKLPDIVLITAAEVIGTGAPCITKMVAMFQSPKAILQEN